MDQQYLTVTALTKYLKRKFDADPYLERIYLTGEISNFRLRANAHQYFSLKDDKAKISAIMFKSAFQKLKFQPKEGMKVLVVGRVSLYENGGTYQIYVEHMEPDGVGALYQALAELRQRLGAEGLFEAPKRMLPRYPKRIAVITSPSGAVIRDIITTVKRRYPIAQLVLFPTLVQGDQAADNIVQNIKKADELGTFDTMIIGRGGGSIEDLWPFNEERVARAIHQAQTPIISSVGHETDVTIADMVADVRAATPTAAAELAVPVLNEELLRVKDRQSRLEQSFLYLMQQKRERFERLKQSYIFSQPNRLYEAQTIKLDRTTQQLYQTIQLAYRENERQVQELRSRLWQQSPKSRLIEAKQQRQFLDKMLKDTMNRYIDEQRKRLLQGITQLDLLSPLKIMGRGYSYTTKDAAVINSVSDLQLDEEIQIHFADGIADARITKIVSDEKE